MKKATRKSLVSKQSPVKEMKLGPISRAEAVKLDSVYVKWVEKHDSNAWSYVADCWRKLRRGMVVLTKTPVSFPDQTHPFMIAKVSSVNHNDFRALDGPVVRLQNGQFSWRADGCGFAVPIEDATDKGQGKGAKPCRSIFGD